VTVPPAADTGKLVGRQTNSCNWDDAWVNVLADRQSSELRFCVCPVVLAGTLTSTTPVPDPDAPPTMAAHVWLLEAIQAQPAGATTGEAPIEHS